MSIKVLAEELRRKQQEIETYARKTFPQKAGKVAVDHIRDNFRQGGFVNNGLHKWLDPKRLRKKGKAAARHKTLLSGRNHLHDSFRSEPSEDGIVVIRTDVEYAAIHNYGGEITHTITRKQRVKATETHLKKTGTKHREKNSMWRGLALTPKTSYVIKMPQRQFIGPSKELETALHDMAVRDIERIFK